MQERTKIKATFYIIFLVFVFLALACKSDKSGATDELDETEIINSELGIPTENNDESIPISDDPNEGYSSNNDAMAILSSQMLGKLSLDKKMLSEKDLTSLDAILEKYPELKNENKLVITENTVDIDVPALTHSSTKMDEKDIETINLLLPKMVSSAASGSRNNHPYAGTFIEEDLKETRSGSIQSMVDKKMLYQNLRNADAKEAQQMLADHYDITLEEVDLLKSIARQPWLVNEKQAKDLVDPEYNKEVEAALTNPKTSSNFKSLVNKNKETQKQSANKFLEKSLRAREAFFKLNPGWYAEKDDGLGNTYADTKNKQIYLPLGKLSFADIMIDFDPGSGGLYPEGALHEPDLTIELANLNQAKPEMCNIGLSGILTLQFIDNAITDVNGPDLYVFEAGAIEPTILELSKDGSNWLEVGKIEGGTAIVDIHDFVKPGETFTYVRLTDLNTQSGVPGADIDAVAAIGGALRLNLDSSVLFEFGKYDLKPEAKALLTDLIPQIESMGKGIIVVEGHTDNVGSSPANKKLSEQRAHSVGMLLKALMEETSENFDWQIVGHGDTQPVAPNNNDENRQKNRRVELLVLPN